MFCRLPGKLQVMDKEPYFACSTQFQELSCWVGFGVFFFLWHFQPHTDILYYKIPSAITNELMPLCLILTPINSRFEPSLGLRKELVILVQLLPVAFHYLFF